MPTRFRRRRWMGLGALILALSAQSVIAAAATSANEELERQRALIALYERAEQQGQDGLGDRSLKGVTSAHEKDAALLASLKAISTQGFSQEDQMDHDILVYLVGQRIEDFALKTYEMPISPRSGVVEELSDLANKSLTEPSEVKAYLTALETVPQALEQTTEILKLGERDQLMPPKSLIDQSTGQCRRLLSDGFKPGSTELPAGLSGAEKDRLLKRIDQLDADKVRPSLAKFCSYLGGDYRAHGRETIGIGSLPSGALRYRQLIREQTTTDMTADEIHALGLSEVSRINTELTAIARRAGFADLAAYRQALKVDPKYIPTSADQIVEDFKRHVASMRPKLPLLFNDTPSTKMEVVAMSPDDLPQISHHMDGSADGKTPGRILVAVSDYAHRSLIGDETIAYHEGLPGHELQVSIAQRLKDRPKFRRELQSNAYSEGWAVYAEALGKEVGEFQDPASDYGRLNTELMRAVRLVVDTGIHAQGWDRDRAVAYWRSSGAVDEPTLQSEIDRSIMWPAQGLSYKVGQLTILDLRRRAKAALGGRFDLKAFHAEVLGSGSIPLSELRAKIDGWIDREAHPLHT